MRERTTWTITPRKGDPITLTLTVEQANGFLRRLDRLACALEDESHLLDPLVREADELADDLELAIYGAESFERRKDEIRRLGRD